MLFLRTKLWTIITIPVLVDVYPSRLKGGKKLVYKDIICTYDAKAKQPPLCLLRLFLTTAIFKCRCRMKKVGEGK